MARESRRRRDVGPADVREAHRPAGFRLGRGLRESGQAQESREERQAQAGGPRRRA